MKSGFFKTADRDAWLNERRKGIGASDSPAILGVCPWKSAFQVWVDKCDLAEPDDLSENEAVEFGIRLERPVAEAYAERTGRNVAMWPQFEIVRDVQRNWFCCTPDATQIDEVLGEGLLQVKTTSAFCADDWKDGPPLMYQVQLQHELAVTGYDWGTLVVLIGGQRLRYFDCDRNDKFVAAMLPRLEEFWEHVLNRVPPPVDGSMATAKVLAKLHPSDNGSVVALPDEAAEWAAALEQAKDTIKEAEVIKTEAENKLKAAIADATFGLLPDGSRYSWKTQSRKGYVVEPTTFRTLRKCK